MLGAESFASTSGAEVLGPASWEATPSTSVAMVPGSFQRSTDLHRDSSPVRSVAVLA